MPWELSEAGFRAPAGAGRLIAAIRETARALGRPVRLMEVCGTHTMAIAKAGLRSLLAPEVELLSGPGCPVCVTPAGGIDAALALSARPGVTVADCREAFLCAAGYLAAAGLLAGRGGAVEQFTAGEVSIRTGSAGHRGEELRTLAGRLMAPYSQGGADAFAFRGVPG